MRDEAGRRGEKGRRDGRDRERGGGRGEEEGEEEEEEEERNEGEREAARRVIRALASVCARAHGPLLLLARDKPGPLSLFTNGETTRKGLARGPRHPPPLKVHPRKVRKRRPVTWRGETTFADDWERRF